jgi:glycerol-3-phosphate dehydrogenase
MATSDGRFLFFLPWMGKTLVGTTDVACPKPSPRPQPTEAEIQWLVDEASKYMVFPIRRSDVLSAWSGVRPLAVDPHATGSDDGKTSSLSRDHVVNNCYCCCCCWYKIVLLFQCYIGSYDSCASYS